MTATAVEFEPSKDLAVALRSDDLSLAVQQASSLEKTFADKYSSPFRTLYWKVNSVKSAQDQVERSKNLELREAS